MIVQYCLINRCYIGMSDYINAGRYLNLASNLPVLTPTVSKHKGLNNLLICKCMHIVISFS